MAEYGRTLASVPAGYTPVSRGQQQPYLAQSRIVEVEVEVLDAHN